MDTNFLCFDVETTGFPKNGTDGNRFADPTDIRSYDSARIVQVAWFSKQKNHIQSAIIHPKQEFNINNSNIHGITETRAEIEGRPILDVLLELQADVEVCDCIVAHNVEFDRMVMLSEIHRLGPNACLGTLREALLTTSRFYCTMVNGTAICKLNMPSKRFTGIQWKYPKLSELMNHLGVEVVPNLPFHDAYSDVFYTSACFMKMQQLCALSVAAQ